MEFPDWGPAEEAELATIEAAAIRSSKRRRALDSSTPHRDRDGGDHGFANGGGQVATAGQQHGHNARRLPGWAAAPEARSRPLLLGDGTKSGISDASTSSPNGVWNISRPSCQVNLKVRPPLFSFDGRIVYSRTAREVEKASSELMEIIRSKRKNAGYVSVGFDIEWRPTFRKGEVQKKAAVVQLCVDKSLCHVMHVIHSGITPSLRLILEDKSSIKVGVGISNDAVKIRNDYSVHVEQLEDLSHLANIKLGGIPKTWGLASLTETLTCKQLSKNKTIRLGNWEVKSLSKGQLAYAATDAFASWFLYEALKHFPDAGDKLENIVS